MNEREVRYDVALYSAVHDGNPGDVAFYRRVCAGASNVLELGCGTGRIAARLVDDGIRVVGLDVEPSALALAARRGVETVEGDMRDFRLGERFDRVVVPYNGLYCLLTEAETEACLACVRAHLADGASLVFDAYSAGPFHDEPRDEGLDHEALVMQIDVDGRVWDVYEQSRWWRDTQRIDAFYRHVPRDAGDSVLMTIEQRYLLSGELPRLLARAGLVLDRIEGGFDGQPFDQTSEQMVVHASAR